MTYQIAISQADYPDAEVERAVFDAVDADVVVGHAESPAELVELARGADALLVEYADVTAAVLDALDDLVVVSRYGIGVDNVDVEAATGREVAVTNVPSYCEEEVATHVLALLLTVVRETAQYTAAVESGTWDWKVATPIEPVVGKTVGFVAYGKIPRAVVRLARGFDFEYLVYDPYLDAGDIADEPVERVDFETLLAESDIVSVHAPLVDETRHLFDADAFARMRKDAVLVNTARGPLVDETALNDALREGELGGAGLDVMVDEPVESSPLFELDSVVVTPHVAWYSERSLDEVRRKAAENVVRFLEAGEPHGFVNRDALNR
ncbi:C-terminal binding protein [Halomarina ordinaria]|uniref:C-terminal binding protein n=1 Tax=Halomarina ordinaria TaxID=3033939 RepID=A0ABD5UGU9_9EURY|nr:C-terminal binding protein [Halomarina sp. PSRA2]